MSGFENHGIKHTSPSQINTWIADPAFWVLSKLFGNFYDMGFSAERGKAIETALVNVLANGMSEEQALKEALSSYDKISPISADPKKKRTRGDRAVFNGSYSGVEAIRRTGFFSGRSAQN